MSQLSRQLRTKAEQARRIARQFSGDKAARDMLAFAAELDDQADTLDASGGDPATVRAVFAPLARSA